MSSLKFGCDPEVFLFDTHTQKYVSAAGHFPGTKHEPYKVDCGAIQVDGMALEFNIDPVDNEKDFISNIERVKEQMTSMVKEVNKNWVIRYEPYVRFSKEVWDAAPDSAKELGCDPDYNYNGDINPDVSARFVGGNTTTRTGSGHIHLGWTSGQDVDTAACREDARFIAHKFYQHGVFRPATELEHFRLNFYGQYGAHRPKSYGVELRAPSNIWVSSPKTVGQMFQKVNEAFKAATK